MKLNKISPSIISNGYKAQKWIFGFNRALLNQKLFIGYNKATLTISLLFIGGFVYFDYITFNNLYVFINGASDSLNHFFPMLYYYTDNLTDLKFPFWSFKFDLGMNVYNISIDHNIFDVLLALSGEKNVIYTITYIVILKIVIAGFFFYAYLKKMGFDNSVAFICSISFSFCGYMIATGHWYHYQNYAVFIAIALYFFERWFQDGRWLLLVLIFGLSNLIGLLQYFQLAVFFSIYLAFRSILDNQVGLKSNVKHYFFLVLVFIGGVGISAFYLLPQIDVILQSARSDSSIGTLERLTSYRGIFNIPDLNHWRMILLRYLSSDIFGSFEHYKGVGNYLESPAAYIGLAMFASVPLVIWVRPLHKKIALLGLLSICLIHFLFPFFRSAGNLFASGTYKYTILYISVFLIIIAGFSLDHFFKHAANKPKYIITIVVTFFLLSAVTNLFAFLIDAHRVVDSKVLIAVNMFMGLYVLLFMAYAFSRLQWVQFLIIGVMVLEIALFSKITVDRGQGITPQFISAGECYFNHDTNSIIKYLKERDNSFYRISKGSQTCTLNDALVQGYNGTTGYHGFASKGHVLFFKKMGLSLSSPRLASYRYGFERSPYLSSLFNVKYHISDDPFDFPEGFKLLKRFGSRYLFENQYYLPLGIVYTSRIPPVQIEKQKAYSSRRALLLKGFIAGDHKKQFAKFQELDVEQIHCVKAISSEVLNWIESTKTIDIRPISFEQEDSIYYVIEGKDPRIIYSLKKKRYFNNFKITLDIESEDKTIGQIFWRPENNFSENRSITFQVKNGRHTYSLDAGKVSLRALRLDVGTKVGQKIHIHNVRLFSEQMHGIDIEKTIHQLYSESLKLIEFSDDYLKGTIEAKMDSMLFFSIPYDHGWSAWINGKKHALEKINFGFLGMPIPPGKHTVELKFRPKYLGKGILVSVLSLWIVLVFYFLFPRRRY